MNRVPLILAIVLLLLPVLYVGSYSALVVPEREVRVEMDHIGPKPQTLSPVYITFEYPYRFGNEWSAIFFWPLEQIDRKVRPGAWELRTVPVKRLPLNSAFPARST